MGRLPRIAVIASLVVLVVVIGLVGDRSGVAHTAPAFSVATAWPMYGGDPSHMAASARNGPSTADLAWTFDLTALAHSITISPVVGPDGTVYVPVLFPYPGVVTGLYAVNSNGTLKWRTGTPTAAPAAVGPDGAVYYTERDLPADSLRALDPATGGERWHVPANVNFSGPTVASDGGIYIGGVIPNQLVAINANGSERWRLSMPGGCGVPSSPAIGPNGNVYAARHCGDVVAVNSAGQQLWAIEGLSSYNTDVWWAQQAVGPDGTVYSGSPLAALNPDGTFKWQQPYSNTIAAPAVSADGALVFYACSTGADAILCAFDRNGFMRWQYPTGRDGDLGGAVSAANGVVYVAQAQGADGQGFLHALRQSDGSLLWRYDMRGVQSTPAIGPDGTVYALGWGVNGRLALYAFRASVTDVASAPLADLSIVNRFYGRAGSASVFELRVTNSGTTTATDVEIRNQVWKAAVEDYLLDSLHGGCREGPSISNRNQFNELLSSAELICDIGALEPGATRTIMVAALPSITRDTSEPLHSRASARAREAELTPADNLALASSADPAPPSEDNFEFARDLGSLPAHQTVNTANATLETLEPPTPSGCPTVGKSVWYTVTQSEPSTVIVSTAGSDFDTVVGVYTGSALGGLTHVACNDDFNGTPQSRVSFTAAPRVVYHLQVAGKGGTGGALVLDVANPAPPANDAFGSSIVVGSLPARLTSESTYATTESGEPTILGSCGVIGSTLWYTVTRPVAAQVTISTAGSSFDTIIGVYTGASVGSLTQVACNEDFNGTPQSQVSFRATAGTVYMIQVGSGAARGGSVVLDVTEVLVPTNDAFASAINVGMLPSHLTANTTYATTESGESPFAGTCGIVEESVWYTVVSPMASPLRVSTAGSDFDSIVAVYTGTGLGALTAAACNDDFNGTPQSQVTFSAAPGTTYYIQAGSHFASAGGNLVLDVTALDVPPSSQVLTITRVGTGTGSVTSSPVGISCGSTCSHPFAAGAIVTLTASEASGSRFSGWSGACSGTRTCQVTMDAAKSVTATFESVTPPPSNTFMLTVTRAGTGSGTVTGAGITCGTTCQAQVAAGSPVTLAATPDHGSSFAGWGGACSGTGTCQITMDAAKTLTASFQRGDVGVGVGTSPGVLLPNGDKQLIATLTARAGCGVIDRIRFGSPGQLLDNARVAISSPGGGPGNQTMGFTYTPPPGTTSVSLTIQRVAQSGGAIVSPIYFYDSCGQWRTFVGGGPDAFR